METVQVTAGDSFALELLGTWDVQVEGFSLSIAFPPVPPIDGLNVTVTNTIVGSLDADFVQANIFPSSGSAVLGVLIDSLPPFGEPVLEPFGAPLAIAEIVGTVPETTTAQDIAFDYVDGLGSPPTSNVFVVATQSLAPLSTSGGTLEISEPISNTPVFIRGDAFLNNDLDISDIIYTLVYIFVDGPAPLCLDAADTNDDGTIDLGDGIYLINYLFNDGPNPLAPFPAAGEDTTPDTLDCAVWI